MSKTELSEQLEGLKLLFLVQAVAEGRKERTCADGVMQMSPSGEVIRWEEAPEGVIREDGRVAARDGESPQEVFSVAISGRLDRNRKHGIEVFYSGNCNYFGIGVAVSDSRFLALACPGG